MGFKGFRGPQGLRGLSGKTVSIRHFSLGHTYITLEIHVT